jgi:hypothetical protein
LDFTFIFFAMRKEWNFSSAKNPIVIRQN